MPLHDNTDAFCQKVCSVIRYHRIHDRVMRELAQHIEDLTESLMKMYPISEEDARKEAIRRMGDPYEIGNRLNREHRLSYYWIKSLIQVLFLVGIVMALIYLIRIVWQYIV